MTKPEELEAGVAHGLSGYVKRNLFFVCKLVPVAMWKHNPAFAQSSIVVNYFEYVAGHITIPFSALDYRNLVVRQGIGILRGAVFIRDYCYLVVPLRWPIWRSQGP